MKNNLLVLLVLLSGHCISQELATSPWHIQAENINPNNYYGITVANGMVGLISSPEPMKMKDVVLNGIYDNYQRGRVSNILKTFNHVNLDLDVDKIR
ncbi:MAG: glycoside hydrolase family 65 protein, partial [Cytophagales bacterium]|nr:glycoside hydrolase family 65 protein [Cytophagales bacterium]